jgi:hypothetical protein
MLKKLMLAAGLACCLVNSSMTIAHAEGNGLLGPSSDPSDWPYAKAACQIPQSTLKQFQGYLNSNCSGSREFERPPGQG